MSATQVAQTPSQKVEGGHAVVILLYSVSHILLVRNLLNPDPIWKLAVETCEPSEPVLNALVGGLREEYGFTDAPYVVEAGRIISIGNDRVVVKEVRAPRQVHGRKGMHWQHFYKVRVDDEVLLSLSGKIHQSDADERMETKAFALLEPESMKDFLSPHKPLFQEFLVS